MNQEQEEAPVFADRLEFLAKKVAKQEFPSEIFSYLLLTACLKISVFLHIRQAARACSSVFRQALIPAENSNLAIVHGHG